MQIDETPYLCHLFVCTKSRGGLRRACGDHESADLKGTLKDEVKNRGWKSRVRVSDSGCMGLCDEGPNVMLYPQKIWYSEVTPDDIPAILEKVGELIGA